MSDTNSNASIVGSSSVKLMYVCWLGSIFSYLAYRSRGILPIKYSENNSGESVISKRRM